jgi:hypothetical protein
MNPPDFEPKRDYCGKFSTDDPPHIGAVPVAEGEVLVMVGVWEGHGPTAIGAKISGDVLELRLPVELLDTLRGMTGDEIRIHLDDTFIDEMAPGDWGYGPDFNVPVYLDEVRVLAQAIAMACEGLRPHEDP